MKFVIAFKDGDIEHYYRKEIYEKGEFIDYGMVISFDSKKEAEEFMYENCDFHAYNFYVKKV